MTRLTGAEVCEEYIWLVSNGMSIPLACQALGKTIYAMEKQLARYGHNDYTPSISRERNYKRFRVNERQKTNV